jgi:hypothetical protein
LTTDLKARVDWREELRRLCEPPDVPPPEREDLRCSSFLRTARRQRREQREAQGLPAMPSRKNCANPTCPQVTFTRNDGEPITKYLGRSYCSRTCQAQHVNRRLHGASHEAIMAAQRSCCVCGVPLERREDEEWSKFRKRKTCGQPACTRHMRRAAVSIRMQTRIRLPPDPE